jgi:hypothetical protein
MQQKVMKQFVQNITKQIMLITQQQYLSVQIQQFKQEKKMEEW